MNGSGRADYVNTGAWSKKAIAEAKRYGTVNVVASSEEKTFSYIPELAVSDGNIFGFARDINSKSPVDILKLTVLDNGVML